MEMDGHVAEVAFVAALLAIILPAVSIRGGLGLVLMVSQGEFHQEMMWVVPQAMMCKGAR